MRATDVRAGDELWNSHGSKLNPWSRVTAVRHRDASTVVIETCAWQTWKHPQEGVTVKRTA